MEENNQLYNIMNDFIVSLISMKKISEKYYESDDLFRAFQIFGTSDKNAVRFIVAYKQLQLNGENDESIKKYEDSIESDTKLKLFNNQIIMHDNHIRTKNPYIKLILHEINDEYKMIKLEIEQMKNNQIRNLISLLESLVSNLTVNYIRSVSNQDILNDQKIKYNDIKHLETMQDLKDFVLEQKVVDMMYDSFNKWLTTFISNYTKEKAQSFNSINKELIDLISEVFERRNILTHNNGIVSHLYISRINELSISNELNIGEKIKIDEDYLSSSRSNVFKMGIILFFLSVKSLGCNRDSAFITKLTLIGLELLNNDFFSEGKLFFSLLLENDKTSNEDQKEITLYNLWLSQKLMGDHTCDLDIQKHFDDKSEINSQQEMASAIFLNDSNYLEKIEAFFELVDVKQIIIILQWPIFKLVKQKDDFIAFQEKYLYNNFEEEKENDENDDNE